MQKSKDKTTPELLTAQLTTSYNLLVDLGSRPSVTLEVFISKGIDKAIELGQIKGTGRSSTPKAELLLLAVEKNTTLSNKESEEVKSLLELLTPTIKRLNELKPILETLSSELVIPFEFDKLSANWSSKRKKK